MRLSPQRRLNASERAAAGGDRGLEALGNAQRQNAADLLLKVLLTAHPPSAIVSPLTFIHAAMEKLGVSESGMLRPVAVLFAAGVFLLPSSFSSAQTPTIDLSRTAFLIGAAGETAADELAKDFDAKDVLGDRPAMSLAVNGRVVATDDEATRPTASGRNWTFLLLGCAGLVVARLARRPVRCAIISA